MRFLYRLEARDNRDAPLHEDWLRQSFLGESVSDQPRMPPIAIRETVDHDEPVAEFHRDLVRLARSVTNPVPPIVEKIPMFDSDLELVHADVPARAMEFPGPFPGIPEHSCMQMTNEFIRTRFRQGERARHRPLDGVLNDLPFEHASGSNLIVMVGT